MVFGNIKLNTFGLLKKIWVRLAGRQILSFDMAHGKDQLCVVKGYWLRGKLYISEIKHFDNQEIDTDKG